MLLRLTPQVVARMLVSFLLWGIASSLLRAQPELIAKIQRELSGPLTADSRPQAGVPRGEYLRGEITDSKIYPGMVNSYQVYVPAQYSPQRPACLLISLDGFSEGVALDNLIAKGAMPVTIAVGIGSGVVKAADGRTLRFNRSYEFDSINDNFANYVLGELLPRVESLSTKDGRIIRISSAAKDRAATGGSTGGIGSFTLAWQRPDSFSRVYSKIGTFVPMRGGDEYQALVRKTEPKAIRIFLEDGAADTWNPLFGSWFAANQTLESALGFAGYDVQHAWGIHGHDGKPGAVIFPDVMRWLWRDWPQPIAAGVSNNNMLKAILPPGEPWQVAAHGYRGIRSLASNDRGEVFFGDSVRGKICQLNADLTTRDFAAAEPGIAGAAFGPDGRLFVSLPARKAVLVWDRAGRPLASLAIGVAAARIVAGPAGDLYVTEPGLHLEEPSALWRIAPDGARTQLDEGLNAASGLVFSPDHASLFAAEASTQWIYSFVVNPSGLSAKQRFYWLHNADIPNNSGAQELAVDREGTLYAATRLGVQVCDRNGRVRAILSLPTPCGPALSLCWGGAHFDQLYVTDGSTIFCRRLLVPGFPQWAAPIHLPPGSGS